MEITPTILLQWNILLEAFGHVDGIWPIKFAQTLFQAKALCRSDSSAHQRTPKDQILRVTRMMIREARWMLSGQINRGRWSCKGIQGGLLQVASLLRGISKLYKLI